MWRVIFLLLCIFPSSVLFASSGEHAIFHAEDEGEKLPKKIKIFLEKMSPNTASNCGFSGKEIFLSDAPNGFKYYAIGPGEGGCIGSGGTTLWVVSLKDAKATLLADDIGFQIFQLDKISSNLHGLKFTGGSIGDFNSSEWSYDGSNYKLTRQKFFVPKDCKDSVKSKDPDFPWGCDEN